MLKGCTSVCRFKKYFSSGCSRLRSVCKQRSEPEYLFWMSVKRRESLYTSYYLWFWSRWKAANTKCLLLSYYIRATACLEWLKSGKIFLESSLFFQWLRCPCHDCDQHLVLWMGYSVGSHSHHGKNEPLCCRWDEIPRWLECPAGDCLGAELQPIF